MASTDDVSQPAPSDGGPPSNRGNGPPVAAGSACEPEPNDRGWTFGDYQLLEKIGETELAVVFRARCKRLDRIVAIRILRFPVVEQQRFDRCMRPATGLNHPIIPPIYEVGQHDGLTYVSMKHVTGRSLAQIGDGKPLPAARAVGYVMQIAGAVDYAHRCGVLHRDLKPSNVIVDEHDRPYLFGFETACRFDARDPSVLIDNPPATPAYLSPEQVGGKDHVVGRESDIYSLGVILYELLTGRCPFSGNSLPESMRQVLTEEPPSPRRLNPIVPRDLETICQKCLEKKPNRRYPTAAALAADLGRFLSQKPILARPVGRIEKARRWLRRKRSMSADR